MSLKISNLALWLFVINLGVVFGAGLYESRIEFAQWLTLLPDGSYYWNAEAAQKANTGLRFWVFTSTIPLTLITLINLILSWRTKAAIRKWWLTASLISLAERIFTFSYFIPTMIVLMGDQGLDELEAVRVASQWADLNHLRHLLVLIAWLAALKTFKHFHPNKKQRAEN